MASMPKLRRARQSYDDAAAEKLALLRSSQPDLRSKTTKEVLASLNSDEAILCYCWTPQAVAVLWAAKDSGVEEHYLAESHEATLALASLVVRVRQAVAPGGELSDPLRLSDQEELLKQLIPEEILAKFKQAKRVVVIPDGPLDGIPFELLATDEHLLLEKGPDFVYAPSATIFLNCRKKADLRSRRWASKKPSALVLADPDFSNARQEFGDSLSVPQMTTLQKIRIYGGQLDPLSTTRHAAESIACTVRRAGGEVELLLERDASVVSLRRKVAGRRFIHLHTHGFIGSTEEPYDASLALAIPKESSIEDFGFLTLDELTRTWGGKLSDCELVVLAACQTQVGQQIGGSVLGLPVGFFHAGAPAVVGSLWQSRHRGHGSPYGALLREHPGSLLRFTDDS